MVAEVHLAVVIHQYKGRVTMAEVISSGQTDGLQSNRLAQGVQSGVRNVSIGQAMEEIIRRTILLKDDNNVLNLL